MAEWNDEKAGEAQAWAEEQKTEDTWKEDAPQESDKVVGENAAATNNGNATANEAFEPEPEDKTKSYAEYLAELAEKKLQLGGTLEVRKPNEGASKKMPEGKAIERVDGEEYFAGAGGKAKRDRERKDKNVLVLDHDIQARERDSDRGGRGGRARGGRGRGEGGFRGEGRGRGGRGRGEGRGEYRGARGDFRGESRGRGGREGPSANADVNVSDTSAFPSLGGKS